MDEILSRFPDIAEDIFESLDDESLVRCKESSIHGRKLEILEKNHFKVLTQCSFKSTFWQKLGKFDGYQTD